MNGLVLRDYLVTGLGANPVQFAESYYLNYPKIAPLVWPPFFHAALAVFLLPRWSPHAAALLLVALFAAATAFRLSRFLEVFSTPLAARVLPLSFLAIPLIVDVESAVMVDTAIAATAMEATWWLHRYFVGRQLKHAALFGCWAACCCLTKGNGVAMVLLPGIAIALTRQGSVLTDKGLYLAGAIVAIVAGPFVYISYRFGAAMGDFTAAGTSNAVGRLGFFLAAIWEQLTPVAAGLAVLGILSAMYDSHRRSISPQMVAVAMLVSLAAAGVLFHSALPLQYPDSRYVIISIAPVVGLVPLGAALLARLAPQRMYVPMTETLVCIAAVTMVFLSGPLPARQSLGFRETVDALSAGSLAGERVLIVSDEYGEGALVSEVALLGAHPRPVVIRASKLLIEQNWMHGPVRPLFKTSEDTLKNLQDLHLRYLILDRSGAAQATPFWSHIRELIADYPGEFETVYTTSASRSARTGRAITVYRVLHHSPGSPKDLRLAIQNPVGTLLD